MKSLKYIIVLGIVTGVTFSSCEDWLDENPKYSVDNTVIFDSEETAKQALDACYGYLTTQDCFGQGVYEMSVGSSGLSWSQTNGSEPDRYASLNATTAGDAVLWAWRGLYKAIQECNTFIVNMNKGSLSEDLKENYTAQASFIRGLCYYYLSMMWGDVPLRIEPSAHDAISEPKSSFIDVVGQIFIDWKYAYDNLPENGEHVDGYIDKLGVAAYLAKLNWMLSCNPDLADRKADYLEDAKFWCDLVYGKYSLQSRYSDLFVNHVQNSPESIFQLNFTTSSDYSWNRLNWIFAADNASPGTAYQRIRSTKAFHDLFRGTYPGDPRYDATFLTRWYDVKNGSSYHLISDSVYTYPYKTYKTKSTSRVADAVAYIPYDQMDDPTNPTVEELTVLQEQFYTENTTTGEKNVVNLVGQFATSVGDHAGWPLWKKQIDFNCQAQQSNNNIILYRYADILLMKAEAKNALGQDPSAEINEVRKRAYKDKYEEHIYVNSTKEANDAAILKERLLELAFEGKRWWDLVRFDKAFDLVPSLREHKGEDYMMLFPIPLSTISVEPKVTQNPGWDK